MIRKAKAWSTEEVNDHNGSSYLKKKTRRYFFKPVVESVLLYGFSA